MQQVLRVHAVTIPLKPVESPEQIADQLGLPDYEAELAAAIKAYGDRRGEEERAKALGRVTALESAIRGAPHDFLCRAISIVEGPFPTYRGAPPQSVRPRQPPDEALCSCWKRAAAPSGDAKGTK